MENEVTKTPAPPINIHQAMIRIMRSVEAIKKEKTNTQGSGFKYRGIDDVMNSLHNAFAEAGVYIMPEVLERKETERVSKQGGALFYVTQTIRFNFIAEDGSAATAIVNGTAMDSGDKADNKGMSIGLKYALLQAFLIPTEDMAEPDSQTHEVKPIAKPAPAPARTAQPPAPTPRPDGKIELNQKIWDRAIARMEAGENIVENIRKVYVLTPEHEAILKTYEQKFTPPLPPATAEIMAIPDDIEAIINENQPSRKAEVLNRNKKTELAPQIF